MYIKDIVNLVMSNNILFIYDGNGLKYFGDSKNKRLIMLNHWFCIRFEVWKHGEEGKRKESKEKMEYYSTFLKIWSVNHFFFIVFCCLECNNSRETIFSHRIVPIIDSISCEPT